MKKKTIHLVCAARPNFMKIAPLYHALKKKEWANAIIVHTGQHYDLNMSQVFFNDLRLPKPDIHLGVGSGSHANQTGRVMIEYEKIALNERPDLIVVVGDVNSTLAVTLCAAKLQLKVAHLEAGLRSFDRSMPEEINRIVTDALSDLLWTPSEDADINLIKEGIDTKKIFRVGNIMIDSLEMLRDRIENSHEFEKYGMIKGQFGLLTLHRPNNVDNDQILKSIVTTILRISKSIPLIFPIHPRTRKNLRDFGLESLLINSNSIFCPDPMNYINFMNLLFNCNFIITDSGGVQEESTYLGIPCFTLRSNTERPITITKGTNRLCKIENLENNIEDRNKEKDNSNGRIQLWDGNTASRIVDLVETDISNGN